MYNNTTRLAPQVTFAKRPVKPVSIFTLMNYVSPLAKRFQATSRPAYTPA